METTTNELEIIDRPDYLSLANYPRPMRNSKAVSKVLWKLNKIWELRRISSDYANPINIISELLFSHRKRESLQKLTEFWDSFPKRYSIEKHGISFSENTPGKSLVEVMVEEIYTSIPDFNPMPGYHIVDVGAQYGDYALLCALKYRVSKVTLFEPVPANYEEIQRNISMNGASNITAHNIAISNENGNMEINVDGNMGVRKGNGERISVQTAKLDSLNLSKPDIIKIDVEGFEIDALKGARNLLEQHHPKIILEAHSLELKQQAIDFLSDMNYKLAHVGKVTFMRSENMDFIQNLYFL